jgi:hypothetical protein
LRAGNTGELANQHDPERPEGRTLQELHDRRDLLERRIQGGDDLPYEQEGEHVDTEPKDLREVGPKVRELESLDRTLKVLPDLPFDEVNAEAGN